jgi:hypothetical protein
MIEIIWQSLKSTPPILLSVEWQAWAGATKLNIPRVLATAQVRLIATNWLFISLNKVIIKCSSIVYR